MGSHAILYTGYATAKAIIVIIRTVNAFTVLTVVIHHTGSDGFIPWSCEMNMSSVSPFIVYILYTPSLLSPQTWSWWIIQDTHLIGDPSRTAL